MEYVEIDEQVTEPNVETHAQDEMWAANGLDIALSRIDRLQRSLIRGAELCYEANPTPHTERHLQQCVEGLERFFETVLLTRNARHLDFARITVDGITLSRLEKDFSASLDALMSRQASGDYPTVADILECELLTNLSSWSRALQQLRNSSSSNA